MNPLRNTLLLTAAASMIATSALTVVPAEAAPAKIVHANGTMLLMKAGDQNKLPAGFPQDFKNFLAKDFANLNKNVGPHKHFAKAFVIRAYRTDGFVVGGTVSGNTDTPITDLAGDPVVWVKKGATWTRVQGHYRGVSCDVTKKAGIPRSVWPTCKNAARKLVANPKVDKAPAMPSGVIFRDSKKLRTFTSPLLAIESTGDVNLQQGVPADVKAQLRARITMLRKQGTHMYLAVTKYHTGGFVAFQEGSMESGYGEAVGYKTNQGWKFITYQPGHVSYGPKCSVVFGNKIPGSMAPWCWDGKKYVTNRTV